MKPIDLPEIYENMETFVKERDWDQFHSLKNLSMALSVETSELMEIFQWMSEADANNIQNNPLKHAQLKDEVADVFFYLMRIVDKSGIDLEATVLEKMQKNAAKYPVEKSRGSIKKYTEL
jgi:dCTP diphosphatase